MDYFTSIFHEEVIVLDEGKIFKSNEEKMKDLKEAIERLKKTKYTSVDAAIRDYNAYYTYISALFSAVIFPPMILPALITSGFESEDKLKLYNKAISKCKKLQRKNASKLTGTGKLFSSNEKKEIAEKNIKILNKYEQDLIKEKEKIEQMNKSKSFDESFLGFELM